MAKPKNVRATSHPLGIKINQVMEEKGISGDYVALANQFGIAVPSTYSWIDKGTVSKEHYPALVKWSGRSLDWWLDVDQGKRNTAKPYLVADVISSYDTKWPFRTRHAEFMDLTPEDRARVDGFIAGLVSARKSFKSKTTHPAG